MIFSAFDFKKSYSAPEKKPMRCLSKEKIQIISLQLATILSTFVFNGTNVDDQWRLIKDIIVSCIEANAPIKKILLKNSNNLPWIDKAYFGLSRKRDALFSKAIKFERECGCISESIW